MDFGSSSILTKTVGLAGRVEMGHLAGPLRLEAAVIVASERSKDDNDMNIYKRMYDDDHAVVLIILISHTHVTEMIIF